MANRKVTPLKDEPVNTLDDILVELSGCTQALNALSRKLDSMGGQPAIEMENLSRSAGQAAANGVRKLLEERDRKHKEEEAALKANGQITQEEYFQTLTDRYDEVLDKCRALVEYINKKEPKMIGELNRAIVGIRSDCKSIVDLLRVMDKRTDKSALIPEKKSDRPKFPRSKTEAASFMKRFPLYLFKRLFYSCHIRQLLRICMFTLWAVMLCTLCFVAYDNARLRTVEEKYILLRDFSRLDARSSQRADFIEWLYSDEDEHRQQIDTLWQTRQQRLNSKRQK